MKWWLVLVAFVLGVLVTWLLAGRRAEPGVSDGGSTVSGTEPVVLGEGDRFGESGAVGDGDADQGDADEGDADERDDDDGSAFAGATTEYSAVVGAAESWDRDAQDEDALLPHEEGSDTTLEASEPRAKEPQGALSADGSAAIPPVAEATANGDVAGVGEPDTVGAVEAEAVDVATGEAEAVVVEAEESDEPVVPSEAPAQPTQGAFTFDHEEDGDAPDKRS